MAECTPQCVACAVVGQSEGEIATLREYLEGVPAIVRERDELKATLGWLRAEVTKLRDQAELNVTVAEGTILHSATKVRLKPLNDVVALFDAYPGRTDETERAFEGDTVTNVDGEQIIGHLIDRHRANHPDVDHISPPTPNPHNRSDEETLRWRAYNLGRLHAWLEALNAIRTAAAGKDIGP